MPVDPAIILAKPKITSIFTDSSGRPKKAVRYVGQLQIHLEDQFFPWIIYNAAMDLVKSTQLALYTTSTKYADKVSFLYNPKFTPSQLSSRIRNTIKLIDRYSRPEISDILGKHLEGLVKSELRAQGFRIIKSHTNEYKGVKWTETNHNLDFTAEHKSGNLNIGVEVKNTLSVPEREEIEIKIRLSKHLGLTPVFATRWMKPYVQMIKDNNGFSWFFKTQMYPLGFDNLTRAIWTTLKLPVAVRTELPEKTIPIFERWVDLHTLPKSRNNVAEKQRIN